MFQKNKLSIIMPVYNAQAWIAESIDSVLAQTYTDWELLCVDDGSPDNSAELVRAYAEKDPRIFLLQKENGGVSSARNYGIDHARGEYVAFLDADDLALPTMYETLITQLEKENADCSFCAFTRFFTSGKRLTTKETSFEFLAREPRDVKYFFYSTPAKVEGDVLTTADLHGACWRSIFRAEQLKKHHIRFTEGIRFSEDQVFVVEYLQHCSKLCYTEQPLLLYRAQTKKWVHHNLYESNMLLLKQQRKLLAENDFYSERQKKKLAAYLKYSTYMMILNEDLMFLEDAAARISGYGKEFSRLLTLRGLIEKMKIGFSVKKIVLFLMLKLRLYRLVQKRFPNKRY